MSDDFMSDEGSEKVSIDELNDSNDWEKIMQNPAAHKTTNDLPKEKNKDSETRANILGSTYPLPKKEVKLVKPYTSLSENREDVAMSKKPVESDAEINKEESVKSEESNFGLDLPPDNEEQKIGFGSEKRVGSAYASIVSSQAPSHKDKSVHANKAEAKEDKALDRKSFMSEKGDNANSVAIPEGNMREYLSTHKKKIAELTQDLERIEKENMQLESEITAHKEVINKIKEADVSKLQEMHHNLEIKQREEMDTLKSSNLAEIKKLQETNSKQISMLEADRESAMKVERDNWEKEKVNLEELHKLDIESLERRHQQQLNRVKREVEGEGGLTKKKLQHKAEFTKLTSNVDFLMKTMTVKMEEEFREKIQDTEERETAVEHFRRKNEIDTVKLALTKRKLESAENGCKTRERRLREEFELHNDINRHRTKYLEDHHREVLKELNEKRERVLEEIRQVEQERGRLQKARREWVVKAMEQKLQAESEHKVAQEEQTEFTNEMEQDINNANNKAKELDTKRKELAKQQKELQQKQQESAKREFQLKYTSDDLQTKIDECCYEQRELEIDKQKLENLAAQIEEESRTIYKYKSSIGNMQGELEEMKEAIDNKEAALRNGNVMLKFGQADFDLKQSALIDTHKQYLQDQLNAERFKGLIKLPRTIKAPLLENPKEHQSRNNMKRRGMVDMFNAEEFIKEMKRKYKPNPDYIASERSALLKYAQGLDTLQTKEALKDLILLH